MYFRLLQHSAIARETERERLSGISVTWTHSRYRFRRTMMKSAMHTRCTLTPHRSLSLAMDGCRRSPFSLAMEAQLIFIDFPKRISIEIVIASDIYLVTVIETSLVTKCYLVSHQHSTLMMMTLMMTPLSSISSISTIAKLFPFCVKPIQ